MTGIIVSISIFGISQLIAVIAAYYGMKQNVAVMGEQMKFVILQEQKDRHDGDISVKDQLSLVFRKIEDDVKELSHRVSTLEGGQDEWTKSLRDRTHQLADKFQVLVLKVDRLEQKQAEAEGKA